MASLGTQISDLGGQSLADAQTVVSEQGHQGQVPVALAGADGRPVPGDGQHGSELFSVESGGLAIVGHLGPAHAGQRRVVDQPLVEGVAVEAGESRQAPGYRGSGPALNLG
jgi:hypothetical protein